MTPVTLKSFFDELTKISAIGDFAPNTGGGRAATLSMRKRTGGTMFAGAQKQIANAVGRLKPSPQQATTPLGKPTVVPGAARVLGHAAALRKALGSKV